MAATILEHELRAGDDVLDDDPPVGTINFDGGRNPEIHIGNGEWQPLDDAAHHDG